MGQLTGCPYLNHRINKELIMRDEVRAQDFLNPDDIKLYENLKKINSMAIVCNINEVQQACIKAIDNLKWSVGNTLFINYDEDK